MESTKKDLSTDGMGGGVPLHLRLRMALPTLRESERKVARALLTRLDEVPRLGIVEAARVAGVSEASVMRLCRTLGFRGYTDFKVRLITDLAATDAQRHPVALDDAGDDLQPDDDIATVARKVFHMDMQALADTLLVLDPHTIERAVEVIGGAARLEIFGLGGSSLIAQDAAYRFMRVGVAATAPSDPDMQAVRVALLTPHDAALAISHSGETRDTIDTLALAADAGVSTVAITGVPLSSLARLADIALITSSPDMRWHREAISPRIVQLTLIDTICVALRLRKAPVAIDTLGKIENALKRKRVSEWPS